MVSNGLNIDNPALLSPFTIPTTALSKLLSQCTTATFTINETTLYAPLEVSEMLMWDGKETM